MTANDTTRLIDKKNFPDATEADGVFTGEHTLVTLAMEAASRLKRELGNEQPSKEWIEGLCAEVHAAKHGYISHHRGLGYDEGLSTAISIIRDYRGPGTEVLYE